MAGSCTQPFLLKPMKESPCRKLQPSHQHGNILGILITKVGYLCSHSTFILICITVRM
nr:MAG TPA: hypothetical protein [Herelleviridae sp.]